MRLLNYIYVIAVAFAAMLAPPAFADGSGSPPCQRPGAGAQALPPVDLYSKNGALTVTLDYYTALDSADRTLFCFKTPDGVVSPTLHVWPGDILNVQLINQLPVVTAASDPSMTASPDLWCGAGQMNASSVNIHFHGLNVKPICHSDEVIHTLVNGKQAFQYHIKIPSNEPAGLYWYHPHVHGIAEAALQGGASGAIVVEGLENFQPKVAGLPARVLLIRDQVVAAGSPDPGGKVPAWDISLNYVPISYPEEVPAVIKVVPGQKEFWRVANTSADTVVNLQLVYDGVVQPVTVVGLDGVPVGSQDGGQLGSTLVVNHILVPPAGRAEFIVTAPPAGTQKAVLQTMGIDTGPFGDNDPLRVLAQIYPAGKTGVENLPTMPQPVGVPPPQRFQSLTDAPISTHRHLYFSEVLSDPTNPASPTNFFITELGATPKLFDGNNPPAIVTTRGSVELWTIENRAQEVHEFHMHQIHFQLRERNYVPVAAKDRQFYDTIQVPYWTGVGPYPSVTVAMDFRGAILGDFVYHCHILGHEDNGMMAIIRVTAPPS